MKIVIWICEGTWPACVDAVKGIAGADDAEIVLLHVLDEPPLPPRTSSLFGPGKIARAEHNTRRLSREAAEGLLSNALDRLSREAEVRLESGPTERIVTAAAAGADYLILGRDGDLRQLGPRSLGRQTRFVVDHAPCTVVLVWPEAAPSVESIPPPPAHL